jgi:hypothetical protein
MAFFSRESQTTALDSSAAAVETAAGRPAVSGQQVASAPDILSRGDNTIA